MPLSLLVVGMLGIQAEVTRFSVHHEVLYWGIRVTHGRAEVCTGTGTSLPTTALEPLEPCASRVSAVVGRA